MRRKRILHGLVVAVAVLLVAWGADPAKGKPFGNEQAEGKGNDAPARFGKYQHDYFDNFYGIASPAPSCYWIVGNSGRILFSLDGGKSWQVQKSGTAENLYSVTFTDLKQGWACGGGGTILHTEDGGGNWTRQNTGTKQPIFRIQFLNERLGYACGYFGLLLRTSDGGKTWADKSIGEDVTLRGLYFVDQKVGYIAGEFGTILKTQDGGSSFFRLNSPFPQTLFAVYFFNERNGYVAGIDGAIFSTVDGGRSWKKEESGVKDHLIGIHGNGSSVVAVGLRGAVTAKGAGGKWIPADTKTLNWFSCVLLTGSKQGFAVGAHATILRLEEIMGRVGGN